MSPPIIRDTRPFSDTTIVKKISELSENEIDELERIIKDDTKLPRYWIDKYVNERKIYWDLFYKRNKTNFFKDRRWLAREFPELRSNGVIHSQGIESPATNIEFQESKNIRVLIDVGCGVGNALLPLLKVCSDLHAYAFDSSDRAIDFLNEKWEDISSNTSTLSVVDKEDHTRVAELDESTKEECLALGSIYGEASVICGTKESNSSICKVNAVPDTSYSTCDNEKVPRGKLIKSFVWDIAEHQVDTDMCPVGEAHLVLLLFVLSAMSREEQIKVVRRCAELLRPGGVILFRDYGRYDLAQIRFAKSKKAFVSDNLYVRCDGTLAYYFLKEEVCNLFKDIAMLEEIENEYCLREFFNAKTEVKMRRVWVQSRYRKPLDG